MQLEFDVTTYNTHGFVWKQATPKSTSCHHFPYDIAILGIPFPDTHTFVGSHAKPRVAKLQCQAAEQRAPKECATTSKVWVFH